MGSARIAVAQGIGAGWQSITSPSKAWAAPSELILMINSSISVADATQLAMGLRKCDVARVRLVKKLSALYAFDEAGEAVLRRLPPGEIVEVEITRPRNAQFHRKFFAMLQIILSNQEHYKSLDDLLAVCKLRIGHSKKIQTAHGIVEIPASISFASMDDIGFANFYDRACQWVLNEVLPGLERHHLDEEVAQQLMEFGGDVPEPMMEGS